MGKFCLTFRMEKSYFEFLNQFKNDQSNTEHLHRLFYRRILFGLLREDLEHAGVHRKPAGRDLPHRRTPGPPPLRHRLPLTRRGKTKEFYSCKVRL